jgi:1,2-dihydroxy-3-keto-5-methylthiopentene dioxygenase
MARLKTQDGKTLTALDEIRAALTSLQIELAHWPVNEVTSHNSAAADLLGQDSLTAEQKEQLLQFFDGRFEQQKQRFGYESRDLVVLHKSVPGLDDMLKKFDRTHRHTDDEVRYIVDGAGIFGFVLPTGEQMLLTVEAGEYIRVPAETEHWFILDQSRRVKAIRYFTNMEGWVANYTDTPIHSALKEAPAP